MNTINNKIMPGGRGWETSCPNHHKVNDPLSLLNVRAKKEVLKDIDEMPYGYDGSLSLIQPCNGRNMRFSSTSIFFVNGILNKYSSAKESAKVIANIFGQNVCLIYSKTEGPIDDIDSAFRILYNNDRTQSVQITTKMVRAALDSYNKLILIGHSRGAAVIQKAVESLNLTEEEGSRIAVLTLGGFCKIAERWRLPTTAMIVSYVNIDYAKLKFDLVPTFVHKTKHLSLNEFSPSLDIGKMHIFNSYSNVISSFISLYLRKSNCKITMQNIK